MSNLSQFAAGGDPQYWVSGATYALGKTVRSPIDHQRYVRIIAGAGTTDPANDATNWRPDGGRAIKSIQRGEVDMASSTTVNITISTVNTAKTELRNLGSAGTMASDLTYFRLTSGTNILAKRNNNNPNATASWELTEYY